MENQKKNHTPLVISIACFIVGMGLGAWGWIKEDCIGPNCWLGSGFIKWTGIAMIGIGLLGMKLIGGKKTK